MNPERVRRLGTLSGLKYYCFRYPRVIASLNPSMKPGRVKRNSGLIGSPFYSSFHELACASQSWSHSTVRRVSFWATSFALRVATSFSSSQSVSELTLSPLESDRDLRSVGFTFPLVLTSAITLPFGPLR